jgi:iron-sulfur cluster assembly protein
MITVLPEAAEWVKKQLEKRGKGQGIRLGAKTSGCSGYMYVLEFVDTPDPDDHIIEQGGVNFYVDPKSLVILAGLEVHYKVDGLNAGIDFVNPNITGACGCGESFSVK